MQPSFLIASPQMTDRWFEKTVVLLCQHDEDGALGLVINREGPVGIGDVLERMDLPGGAPDQPTLWGGPVSESSGFVLWRGRADDDEGWNPGDQVAVSPSADRLESLAQAGQRFHLALGYAGWGPGQLEGEIEGGSWLVADIDGELVMEAPIEQRYDRALALLGLSASQVWMSPVSD
ncbi:MAG: YqgE/AlgH family protein [Alphaproteobacteria bacterium]|nr:YqgE/AlgH family protein [Alphaproteobacteria bacterium]